MQNISCTNLVTCSNEVSIVRLIWAGLVYTVEVFVITVGTLQGKIQSFEGFVRND